MPRRRISDLDILKMVVNKLSISEMAIELHVGKSAISKRVKKLQESGLIEIDIEETVLRRSLTLSDIKIFKLTKKGKMKVAEQFRGSEDGGLARVRGVHNVQFKFKIKKRGELWFDNSVVLKNWIKKYTWFGDIYVEQNGKEDNPSSLVIKFGLEEPDPWKAAYKALETALKMKRIFEDMVGFELSDPVMVGKPKWEITGDAVAKKVSQKQVIVTDCGAIDNTPEPGTLHLYDPEDVETYLRMPREIREMHQEIKLLENEIRQIPELITSIVKELAADIGKKMGEEIANAIRTAAAPQTKTDPKDRGLDGYA